MRDPNVHSGEVVIYLEAISAGLRFTIHPFFWKVLHSLHVAPIQLNPNVYRFLYAWFVPYHKLSLGEPSVYELRYIYTMKSHPAVDCANKN